MKPRLIALFALFAALLLIACGPTEDPEVDGDTDPGTRYTGCAPLVQESCLGAVMVGSCSDFPSGECSASFDGDRTVTAGFGYGPTLSAMCASGICSLSFSEKGQVCNRVTVDVATDSGNVQSGQLSFGWSLRSNGGLGVSCPDGSTEDWTAADVAGCPGFGMGFIESCRFDCTLASDCPNGFDCRSGQCRIATNTAECTRNDDCADDQDCAYGRCVPEQGAPCAAHEDCVFTQLCAVDICLWAGDPNCEDDGACVQDETCVNGFCLSLDSCVSDEDCPAWQGCTGICVPRSCEGDEDCFGGHCDNGLCGE
jgi:hypothetical protein